MEDRKKLIEALQVIANECDKHEICDNSCPLLNEHGRCSLTEGVENPCDWILSDPEEPVWRAFV